MQKKLQFARSSTISKRIIITEYGKETTSEAFVYGKLALYMIGPANVTFLHIMSSGSDLAAQ